jgi:hypothetical protein
VVKPLFSEQDIQDALDRPIERPAPAPPKLYPPGTRAEGPNGEIIELGEDGAWHPVPAAGLHSQSGALPGSNETSSSVAADHRFVETVALAALLLVAIVAVIRKRTEVTAPWQTDLSRLGALLTRWIGEVWVSTGRKLPKIWRLATSTFLCLGVFLLVLGGWHPEPRFVINGPEALQQYLPLPSDRDLSIALLSAAGAVFIALSGLLLLRRG